MPHYLICVVVKGAFFRKNSEMILYVYYIFRNPQVTNNSLQSSDSILSERRNVYDNDEFDIFSRSDVNMENIHIGKKLVYILVLFHSYFFRYYYDESVHRCIMCVL